MAGTVYLRTNRFEVKLEGITFKAKDFGSLRPVDLLFPDGNTWAYPPVVGIDVMRHPRDYNIILVLLCFGVGCVILKFNSEDVVPESIFKFLTDDRISFVGFGLREKKDLFPLEELGLTKNKVDISYLAAKILDDPKYKRYELAELACRVLRVKNMIGLTKSSSFERHERVKCAICQLFITSAIAMALLGKRDKKKIDNSPKKTTSFMKNLNQLPSFTEGWFNFPKSKKIQDKDPDTKVHDIPVQSILMEGLYGNEIADGTSNDDPRHGKSFDIPYVDDDPFHSKERKGFFDDAFKCLKLKDGSSGNNQSKEAFCTERKPLKGILKSSPSGRFEVFDQFPSRTDSGVDSSESSPREVKKTLKRANSKGYNVSFK